MGWGEGGGGDVHYDRITPVIQDGCPNNFAFFFIFIFIGHCVSSNSISANLCVILQMRF